MAYVITSLCIGNKHAACVKVCPCDCIHPTPDEAGFAEAKQLYIDPDPCIDCGLCEGECPARAIFQEDDLPDEHQAAKEWNAARAALQR
ncbi:MAG: ferredoxin family protein [Phycisphaeraceae bacterium]